MRVAIPAFRTLATIFLAMALVACAAPNPDFYYGFEFRNGEDGQTALVMDYRVESRGRVLARSTPFYAPFINAGTWINGPRPTSIYVRWKEGGAEFDQNVDLTKVLAGEDLESKTLHLMFRQEHLSIYHMSAEPLGPGEPRIGPSGAGYGRRKLIYSN